MRILLLLSIVAYHATSLNAEIANGNSDFASKFFKAVAEDKSENIICSPISTELVLIGATFGAGGDTLKQLRSVTPNSEKGGIDSTAEFLNVVDGYKEIELQMASNVFVAKGFSLNSEFKFMMQYMFKSSVENIDFGNAVESSKTINDWSAAHTNNRIKNLVTPEGINKDSSVVLTSAIYFKGAWAAPFYANETQLRPFHVNGKTIKQVPTMYKLGKYLYGKLPKLNASFVEIPYTSHDYAHGVSMYIVRPDEIDGFIELKKKLDEITVESFRRDFDNGDVELFLPKFKIESSLELKDPLVKLGLTDMFTDAANFSGIVEGGNLKITKIIQKAFLEVNEEGSEAGAATAADFGFKSAPLPLFKFVVDRPFFSIIATEFQATLFSALTVDPRTE